MAGSTSTGPGGAQADAAGSFAGVRTARWSDTARLLRDVLGPTVAKGIFIRRYAVVALAAQALDARAVARMAALRERYGPGPLLLPVPGVRQAIVLAHDHVAPILDGRTRAFRPCR